MAKFPELRVPSFVDSDEHAYAYCCGVLTRSDEQYAADTAAVGRMEQQYRWLMDHHTMLTPKEAKKYKQYDPAMLTFLYDNAGRQMSEVMPRYHKLRDYCNRHREAYRKARSQTMPEGRVLGLEYEEYGSSRPDPVLYEIVRDTASGRMMLLGCESRRTADRLQERPQVEVGDSVLDKVRALISEHSIYKVMAYNEEPPAFPKCPQPLGAPPSWRFRCQFEGGTVACSSSHSTTPEGCRQLLTLFRRLLREGQPSADLLYDE